METSIDTITRHLDAFADLAEYALDVDQTTGQYGYPVTVYRFPAAVPEGYDIVRVKLDEGDEAVRITAASSNGVIWYEINMAMATPVAVVMATFNAAAGIGA